MGDMADTLDKVLDSMREDYPELSETEASFKVIRLNLIAMVQSLAEFGMTGEDLPNAGLYGLMTGVVEMAEWMTAKESLAEVNDISDMSDLGDWEV